MIYVMADIHGNESRFYSVMKQIRLQPEDQLYILGDVVDRYPGGIRLLRKIMAMPNAHMVLGNHEYMMLRALGCPYDDFYDDGRALSHWHRNGGDLTHNYWKRIRKSLRQEILDYLLRLPVSLDVTVNGQRYKLAHAAPPEAYDGDPKYRNPVYFAVWKRFGDETLFSQDYTLIFGHTPTEYLQEKLPMEVWYGTGKIGIDCGCCYQETGEEKGKGRLACLRLDDGRVFYSDPE